MYLITDIGLSHLSSRCYPYTGVDNDKRWDMNKKNNNNENKNDSFFNADWGIKAAVQFEGFSLHYQIFSHLLRRRRTVR